MSSMTETARCANRPYKGFICWLATGALLFASLTGCVHRPMYNPGYMTAAEFDEVARTILAPVYPLLARQILLDYGITFGNCLDVGGGAGYLAIELAQRSG